MDTVNKGLTKEEIYLISKNLEKGKLLKKYPSLSRAFQRLKEDKSFQIAVKRVTLSSANKLFANIKAPYRTILFLRMFCCQRVSFAQIGATLGLTRPAITQTVKRYLPVVFACFLDPTLVDRFEKELKGKVKGPPIVPKLKEVEPLIEKETSERGIKEKKAELVTSFSVLEMLCVLQQKLYRMLQGLEAEIEETDDRITLVQNRNLLIKVSSELRSQIDLYAKLLEKAYNIYAVAEFQRTVLDAIASVSPDLQRKIVEELKNRNAIRSLIEPDVKTATKIKKVFCNA